MTQPYKILIVDDHTLFAFGTKGLLEQMDHVVVVGIATTGEACLRDVEAHRPDLVLLDYNLPDQSGYKIVQQIHALNEDIQVVILTGINYMSMYNQLLDVRISGIVSKASSEEQLRNVVRCIMDGQTAIPTDLYRQLRLNKSQADPGSLTPQEIHMMSLVVEGHTHEQISEVLFTSKRSVDNYLRKIYDKLGVSNKNQAIQKFTKSGFH